LGGVLVIFGAIGAIGGSKKNGCLLAIFNLGLFLGFLIFAVIGIVLYVAANEFSYVSMSDCRNRNWSQKINVLATSAENDFCMTGASGCQCEILPSTKFP
jgi:hypothetical protein